MHRMRFFIDMIALLIFVVVLAVIGLREGGGAARDLADLLSEMEVVG